MRRLLLVTVSMLATASVAAFGYDLSLPVPYIGTPPSHVARWIRIIWGGDMNHPIIPVYFLTEERGAPQGAVTRYIVLKPQEYESLARFTHSIRCSVERVSAKSPRPNSIVAQEFLGKSVRDLCVFPISAGCQYLFGIAKLQGIDWSQKDTFPIYQFEAELGCKGRLTESHDAKGHRP